jgi:hypothetical protein
VLAPPRAVLGGTASTIRPPRCRARAAPPAPRR